MTELGLIKLVPYVYMVGDDGDDDVNDFCRCVFPGCVLNADGEWWRGEERPPRAAARLLWTPVLRQTCGNQETYKVFRVSESSATVGRLFKTPHFLWKIYNAMYVWGGRGKRDVGGDAMDNPDRKEPVLIKDFQLIDDSA